MLGRALIIKAQLKNIKFAIIKSLNNYFDFSEKYLLLFKYVNQQI